MSKVVKKNAKTGKVHWPNVFVLMRIYCPDLSDYPTFLEMLSESLESIQSNKTDYESASKTDSPGRVVFLFNDDTERGDDVRHYGAYRSELTKRIEEFFGERGKGWIETEKDSAKEPGGMGSSYSAYLVRELFLYKAENDDIAILLDQDDQLRKGSIRNIARSMYSGGIVVSPFRMKDPNHLDITDDGGRIHNRIARRMSCRWLAGRIDSGKDCLPQQEFDKLFFPHGRNECEELWKNASRNLSLCWQRLKSKCYNFFVGNECVSELSSIGWTKAYTKQPLQQYHTALKHLLESRGGVKNYYNKHRSYEDFVDYYVLLLNGVRVSGTREATHDYIKNPFSITSKYSLEDFSDHRTASLVTLIDLCYTNAYALCGNYKIKLQRFVASKAYQIEKIISQYNANYYKNGKKEYASFAAQTHSGYFVEELSRVALSNSDSASARNFSDLFSEEAFRSNPYYSEPINASTPQYVLMRAIAAEKQMRQRRSGAPADEGKSNLMVRSLTPNQQRLKTLKLVRWIYVAILLLLICCIYTALPFIADELRLTGRNKYLASVEDFQQLLAAFFALVGVVATIIENEIGKVKVLAADEGATVKLYYSEFQDLIRHMEANVKVMIQIHKTILTEGGGEIQDIHFENLKWPTSSILFSDEMAKLIARDHVDDFARLKVNLRNINNSARWLQALAHDGGEMKDALEWEITRYFGYIINLYYLDRNDFRFPSPEEIDRYMHENSIKNKLTSLFMDYPADERLKLVDYFIDRYNDDRRKRRAVLVRP